MIHQKEKVLLLLAASGLAYAAAKTNVQEHGAIDTAKSVMTVRVYKAGALSVLGHDHEIAAPIAGGTADTHHVELRVRAGALRVRDAKGSDKDHEKIQQTMAGPDVLDVARHPDIVFKSSAVEKVNEGSWRVRGNLSLHGETRPVAVEVSEKEGHYVGHSLLSLAEFGIKPVKVAGGTVRVKDEIRIEFNIVLTH
jgi:polyisoprenoid-binding protein YceI